MSINETEYFCFIDGRKTYAESPMKCFFATATLILSNFYFAYICFFLLGIIIIISIFGKITENYRWFILNQAVWDVAITYRYLANDKIHDFVYVGKLVTITSYTPSNIQPYIDKFMADIINTNPYSSLLLLSLTRFLALYFMHFYDRLTSKKRIFFLILFFNAFIMFFHAGNFFRFLYAATRTRLNRVCLKNDAYEFCNEALSKDILLIFLLQLRNVFRLCVDLKPIVFLILTIGATFMIVLKIGKQAKFQLQHNRRDFLNSLRVVTVILFQTFINSILVFIEFAAAIDDVMSDTFGIKVLVYDLCSDHPNQDWPVCINPFQLPEWMENGVNGVGLSGSIIFPAFKQIRIFLESIIILLIMTGYREAFVRFYKFVLSFFKKPSSTSSSDNKPVLFVRRSRSTRMGNSSS